MKAIFLAFLLIPSLSFGALTPAQLEQARQANRKIVDIAGEMQSLILAVYEIVNNNYQYNLSFSTNTVTLTATQQQDIVNYYQSLKAQIVTHYNQLP